MPTSGPKVGELTDEMPLTGIDGNAVRIGGPDPDGLATFILFISPTCPVCKSLVPAARSLVMRESKRMKLVFASDGDKPERHQAYVRDLGIDAYPYIISEALGIGYAVSKLPFAVLIGGDGTLQSKGLVNSREHLESLVEAMDSGYATLQEFVGNNQNESSPEEQAS